MRPEDRAHVFKASFTRTPYPPAETPLTGMPMRRVLLAALFAGLALPAQADNISVTLDEVQTISFPRAVSTVFAGNTAIADITMIDARRAFVQGKAFGSTNIIALDKNGDTVSNTHVSVLSRQQATVTLQRGTQRTTYTCTSARCEVAPQPGDGKDAFDTANGQNTAHQDAAIKAATGPAGN
jgi:Flp pilus assembly secretin CpaC